MVVVKIVYIRTMYRYRFSGISAILGNIAVLFLTARNLSRGRPKLTVEQRLTKYFFFSLSLSDLILAVSTANQAR